jgi:hypothetical protein
MCSFCSIDRNESVGLIGSPPPQAERIVDRRIGIDMMIVRMMITPFKTYLGDVALEYLNAALHS